LQSWHFVTLRGFGAFFGTAGVGRGFLARADVVVAAADFVGALVLLLLA